jgi:FlaA1/EpsC-like NDP-sugar epimerase
MSILGAPIRPRPVSAWWVRLAAGTLKYGPAFLIQLTCFYFVLVTASVLMTDYPANGHRLLLGLSFVAVALGAVEIHFRLYRRVWAVAGLLDAIALGLAVVEATALVTLADVLTPPYWRPFPSIVPVLGAPIVLSLIAAFRFFPRMGRHRSVGENRLLIVVPDGSVYNTVKSLVQSPNALWSAIAIVTAKPNEIRRTVLGLPVVGATHDLEHWIKVTHADGVAIIPGEMPQSDFRSLISICLSQEKPVFVVPPASEWLGAPGTSRLRQLTADDLLSRPNLDLDLDAVAQEISDRVVLVTGAAGSVGSELCKILMSLQPRRLVLVDNNESGLFDLAEELRLESRVEVREALVSVTDREHLLTVFMDERPDLVFHAAAYKHVPMLEIHPEQAVITNVIGTRNAVWCAEAVGTQQFILISTDKVATGHSVMGCTKRLCELMVLGHAGSLHCRAVRFGNVVGSRGSVIPIFERQIHRGGPVTITHPEMTRYMMTARQAASLVVSTVVLPAGHLYMLDMGEPIRILDLANALIRSRGLRPGKDIQVVFTGVRHGERLAENLLGPGEGVRPTRLSSVNEIVTPIAISAVEDLNWTIERLYELAKERKTTELTRVLKQAVWPAATTPTEEPTIIRADQPAFTESDLS